MTEQPISNTWATVLERLSGDEAITPMLQGFLNLVEPKGIAAGTFYLEVPNDFTASMLNQRMRVSLLSAMTVHNWTLMLGWTAVGFAIYFLYGYRNSKLKG